MVWRLTKDPIFLGMVEGANLLPMLLFAWAGGLLADRYDRRKIMITTQALAMIQAIVLAILTLTGIINPWHCLLLAGFIGTVNAFEVPSRQTLLVNMVKKKDLVNAVSLGSSIFNVARSVGPALAGIIVAVYDEGVCFVINAISYTAALIALLLIRVEKPEDDSLDDGRSSFRDGIKFVVSNHTVKRIVAMAIAISLFGLQTNVVMPIFASDILGGGVETLGLLRASNGFGALIAALIIASRGHGKVLKPIIGVACVVYGLMLALFALSRDTWLSVVLMMFTGFALVTMLSGGHSLVQLSAPDKIRGRVMSVYMTILLGLAPFGSLLIGWLTAHISAPNALMVNASMVTLAGFFYVLSLCFQPKESDNHIS